MLCGFLQACESIKFMRMDSPIGQNKFVRDAANYVFYEACYAVVCVESFFQPQGATLTLNWTSPRRRPKRMQRIQLYLGLGLQTPIRVLKHMTVRVRVRKVVMECSTHWA